MKAKEKVLFRVDADSRIGLGHLQRSLSLAAALRSSGVESIFFAQADSHSGERIKGSGFQKSTLPKVGSWTIRDEKATLDAAQYHGCRAVVVDSHEVGADYLAHLRSAGLYVIARDDLSSFPFPCQMVINGNADAPQLAYRSSSGDSAFLLGPEYIVLGQEFQEIPPTVVRQNVKNILVILGGTDSYGLMPKILGSLDMLPDKFTLTAVIGPYFQNVASVESVAEDSERSINLVRSPGSVRHLMLEADLAVSAAGQALYELASMGCPTVAIQIASNQAGQMSTLKQAGVIKGAGDAQTSDVMCNMIEAVRSVMADAKTRADMSAIGQRLVDGQGALRVAQTIRAAID